MKDLIFEKEGHLSRKYCDELIELFEKNKSVQRAGGTMGGVNKNIKVSTDVPLNQIEGPYRKEAEVHMKIIFNSVRSSLDDYIAHIYEKDVDMKKNLLEGNLRNVYIGKPQIQKTTQDGFYRWHHDAKLPGNSRLLTYILYLNDVEEGCGGTTDFACGKSVQPKAGKLVLFPASWIYYHRGKKVEKGVKYIATSFIWSHPPNE